MDTTTFGLKLRELRNAAGLTQQQLADKAGLALRTVSGLEQGRYEPMFLTAAALCKALGVPVDEFTRPLAAESIAVGRGRPPKPSEAPGSSTESVAAAVKPARRKRRSAR
jgi:transcriptional regulator with XRE-family HTH domain